MPQYNETQAYDNMSRKEMKKITLFSKMCSKRDNHENGDREK